MLFTPTNTIVIADFDGTLIQKLVNGKLMTSSASILQHNVDYFTEEGVAEIRHLGEHYYPIELDPTVHLEKKITKMQEWWEKCYDIYKKYHVNRWMIQESSQSPLLQLRSGEAQFFQFLATHDIPLIIYSASGVGVDGITYFLERFHLATSNISICSNDLLFDKKGVFIGVKPPIIHAANKTGDTLVRNHFLTNHPKQRQCILIGDGLEDIRMTEGLDFETVYTVAFGDTQNTAFRERFTLVIPIDGGFEPVLALFKSPS